MDFKDLANDLAGRFARLEQTYREDIKAAQEIIRKMNKHMREPGISEDEWMALFLEVTELTRLVRKATGYAIELKSIL
jgi:hypothetical protein